LAAISGTADVVDNFAGEMRYERPMTTSSPSNAALWAGRILSALVVLAMLADAAVNLFAPGMLKAEMDATGFSPSLAPALGIIMLVSGVLYALPRTATLGAILITGFLGGAICTHFRLGEIGSPPQIICLVLGIMTWGGLYLRNPTVRKLLPLSA
jgi:hypothetical protein